MTVAQGDTQNPDSRHPEVDQRGVLLADRVAIIDHGQISAIDTPRSLIAGLDGRGHIEFATPRPVETTEMTHLAGIIGAAARSDGEVGSLNLTTYRLDVDEPRTAVTSLLNWSEGRGIELRGLEVAPGSLEDVFLQLTGRELKE